MEIVLIFIIVVLLIIFLFVINKYKKRNFELSSKDDKNKAEILKLINENKRISSDLGKFSGVISIENEINLKNIEFSKLQTETSNLNEKYITAKSIFKELEKEINIYRNEIEFIELGIYEPNFNYDTSEKYKKELLLLIEKQKNLIKEEKACICMTDWYIGTSRSKGEIMVRRTINLTLRAFNGESDRLIAKVKWNNIKRFEERIKKSYNAINKLNKSNDIHITEEYLQLKIKELYLTYEFEYKKHEEKEEQKAIRAEQREEERTIREIEKAKKEAEIEEKRFQKALERAQKELGLVSGNELNKLNQQINELHKKLEEVKLAKERAISRAQETKSGHVYIISNIGSFGENIYKIGMTRRLEPMDRIKELGDASVPFRFDLHAMIFTKNAPELENLLQKEFHDRRINKVNRRKEYFRVTLEEIELLIKEKYEKEVEFIKIPEAKEYRETKSIIKQLEQIKQESIEKEIEKYPDSLF